LHDDGSSLSGNDVFVGGAAKKTPLSADRKTMTDFGGFAEDTEPAKKVYHKI
jgi:hypothetical protein